jgi:hypothetical protein
MISPFDATEASHHLLGLPGDVVHEEVQILAWTRFPRSVGAAVEEPVRRESRRGSIDPRTIQLSRLSSLVGPYGVDPEAARDLGLPASTGIVYALRAPVERGDAPWPESGDRNGFGRAFPSGLPVRDEARVLDWALAVARRLGGALRTAPGPGGRPGTVLIPEPAAAVDLTVWSEVWLDPESALAVMRQAVPRASLNLPGAVWQGPPPGVGEHAIFGTEVLTAEQRAAIHAAAEEFDRAALADPEPMRAYGAVADLESDGLLALEVSGEPEPPPVIAGLPWAGRGAVAYLVRWEPPDLDDLESERPPTAHRVARSRVTPLVVAITRALHRTVGGEVTDMMGFIVDPADL